MIPNYTSETSVDEEWFFEKAVIPWAWQDVSIRLDEYYHDF